VQGDDCGTCWQYCAPNEGPRFPGDKMTHETPGCMRLFLSYGLRPLPEERTCKAHETLAEHMARHKKAEAEAAARDAAKPRCPTCGKKV